MIMIMTENKRSIEKENEGSNESDENERGVVHEREKMRMRE